MADNKYTVGMLFIFIAVLLLLGKLGVIGFLGNIFWPVFILLPGLLLNYFYFNRMIPSYLLVLSGVMVTYSLLFLYCNLFGWSAMGYLWPGFLFGVAVGLYEVHIWDRNSSTGVFTAAFSIAVISILAFIVTLFLHVNLYLFAAILILLGILLMMKRSKFWQ